MEQRLFQPRARSVEMIKRPFVAVVVGGGGAIGHNQLDGGR